MSSPELDLRLMLDLFFIEVALYFLPRKLDRRQYAFFVLPDTSEEFWKTIQELAPQWGVSVQRVWIFKKLSKVTVTDFSKLNFTNLTFDD